MAGTEKKKFPRSADADEMSRIRSEGIRELFMIRPGELPMKTETPQSKLDPFVMMETVEYMCTLPNIKPDKRRFLSEVYREAHDRRIISLRRKGRIEIEKVLAAQGREPIEEFGI